MFQNLPRLFPYLIFVIYNVLGTSHLGAEDIFQPNDHCLAYQAEETILLFIDSTVTGKTCEISTQVESKASNTRFLVSFPIRSIDSGVNMRDEDVREMLSIESDTKISFVSDFLTIEQINEALNKGNTSLGGMLKIAGKSHKVVFILYLSEQSDSWLVTGELVTSLSKFGMELPSVLGGVVADTRDYLKLLVHLRFNLMQGIPEFQKITINK